MHRFEFILDFLVSDQGQKYKNRLKHVQHAH